MNDRKADESNDLIHRFPGSETRATDQFLSSLTEEERKSFGKEVGENLVAIDKKTREARLLFDASSADMQRDIEKVREMESASRSDYELSATYRTASGETRLRITKSNNLVIVVIVIAIVVGLIVILSMAK